MGEGQGHRPCGRRASLAHPLPDRRLAAGEGVLGDQPLPDPLRRVAACPAAAGAGAGQCTSDRPAAVVERAGQLPDADALTEVGPSDTLDLRHLAYVVAPARGELLLSPRCWQRAAQGGSGPPFCHRSGPAWVPFSLAFVSLPYLRHTHATLLLETVRVSSTWASA